MRDKENFLVQRYSAANHPQVLGEAPFLATGPNFFGWAVKGSLERRGYHLFKSSLGVDISDVLHGKNTELHRECVAELLLSEGIVQALWAEDSEIPDRWSVSIVTLGSEIPKDGILEEAVIEYLSGLADPGHFRSYVAEDQLELVPCPAP